MQLLLTFFSSFYFDEKTVGRDILNTGEPLAASVTTITSAATSSFANAIYRLEVTTGACRGAGTCGRVNVILIGQDGLTYPFDLEYAAGDVPAIRARVDVAVSGGGGGTFRTDSESEGEIVSRRHVHRKRVVFRRYRCEMRENERVV